MKTLPIQRSFVGAELPPKVVLTPDPSLDPFVTADTPKGRLLASRGNLAAILMEASHVQEIVTMVVDLDDTVISDGPFALASDGEMAASFLRCLGDGTVSVEGWPRAARPAQRLDLPEFRRRHTVVGRVLLLSGPLPGDDSPSHPIH